jgi:glycerol kinase
LLTTVASRIDGKLQYGLEGSVFVAGSAIQWLRDELKVIADARETHDIAETTGIVDDVYVVPAFAGLGAPYWNPDARGAIVGLSRGSHRDTIVTATLQAVAFQTADLMQAMHDDGVTPDVIRVDGGMVANDWFLQFLANILNTPIERPTNIESTVLGAAYLAACGAGLIATIQDVQSVWKLDQRFEPDMPSDRRELLLAGWQRAVRQVQAL